MTQPKEISKCCGTERTWHGYCKKCMKPFEPVGSTPCIHGRPDYRSCPHCLGINKPVDKGFNDLKPFIHGEEGTHSVCNKHNIGGKSLCCECSGKTDCDDTPQAYMRGYEDGMCEATPQYKKDMQDCYNKGRKEVIEKVKEIIINTSWKEMKCNCNMCNEEVKKELIRWCVAFIAKVATEYKFRKVGSDTSDLTKELLGKFSSLRQADKEALLEEKKQLDPELKQCPQCHTMKLFTTNICYRCLDQNEARRIVYAEIDEWAFNNGITHKESFRALQAFIKSLREKYFTNLII